ncbi:hypothetical protein BSLA_03f0860 [Burkholderia stabilis]|nr:hypothetical protein BSLA_03f0860 [Burkholderia stabilis]
MKIAEPFRVAMIEAMSCGTPAMAFKSDGTAADPNSTRPTRM